MATFYNQASLSYNGKTTNSNVTVGEILDSLAVTKNALTSSYRTDDSIVYMINISNTGATAVTGLSVTDDLGAYTVGGTTVYPLEYLAGSVMLFINGVAATAPSVSAGPPLVISGINIPAGANASLIYEASVTEFAPLALGSSITNTATVTADTYEPITDTATVNTEGYTELTIAKAMCPATVTGAGEITYTFIIQNSGNEEVVATDNVVVNDTFTPALSAVSVTYNGTSWAAGTNYTYDETSGEFATVPGEITIPAATYVTDSTTGAVSVTPGVTVITVTGTI